ncbi:MULTISPECIES: transcriptional regulator [unclassified Haloparvum]|uniref:transcriptional regulator n=1 Tax=Haloparvum sp. PAK95 TaxID=3418962 RepID=UPI003D2F1F9C
MADLHPVAKRIHNVQPDPVRLTLDDDETGVFRFSSTEFFQQEFRGEGAREGDDADYRLVSSEDNERILLGRKGPDEESWSMVAEVTAAEAVDSS